MTCEDSYSGWRWVFDSELDDSPSVSPKTWKHSACCHHSTDGEKNKQLHQNKFTNVHQINLNDSGQKAAPSKPCKWVFICVCVCVPVSVCYPGRSVETVVCLKSSAAVLNTHHTWCTHTLHLYITVCVCEWFLTIYCLIQQSWLHTTWQHPYDT